MTADLSVIIVSYNQFATTTGPCLQSLARQDLSLEIIVVDNGSDQESVDQLRQAAAGDGRIKLLLHSENKGYAAANNDGVQMATSDHILLLNSDTLISANGLSLLVSHLQGTDSPCLVGPVTNAAGNEQQIHIRRGSDEAAVLAQGARWSSHAAGSVFMTDQLSFFCVAMARKTYLDLAGLDPCFGLGFYEDADFCCRAAGQGISLQVVEECFVFHQGSAGFSRVPDTVKQLLAVNRKLFRSRHGRGEGVHVRWKNILVLQGYLDQYRKNGLFREYLFDNRLQRARCLTPNNPLKKIRYAWYLSRLEKERGGIKGADV
jgi:GT2 family glycosyltransferase